MSATASAFSSDHGENRAMAPRLRRATARNLPLMLSFA